MEVKIKKENNVLTVFPIGKIDSVTSEDFSKEIHDNLNNDITELVIDMKDVSFISSKGIRILLSLHREMSIKGKLILTNINNSVREVLRMSALLEVFNVQ